MGKFEFCASGGNQVLTEVKAVGALGEAHSYVCFLSSVLHAHDEVSRRVNDGLYGWFQRVVVGSGKYCKYLMSL